VKKSAQIILVIVGVVILFSSAQSTGRPRPLLQENR